MAKLRRFKCPKCDRTFSMAAHLGRHMNTIHASKAKKKATRKKVAKRVRRTAAGPAAWPAGLIREIRTYQASLTARREELDYQIGAVDKVLSALGAAPRPAARGPSRARRGAGARKGSLKDYVARVLRARKGSAAVKDVTAAVLRAGYKSKNKTLDKSVGIALTQMSDVVKVARGQYRLR